MARVGVAAVLGLAALLLPTAPSPCPSPRPGNTTASKLLGTWLYVAGAAQLPQHLLEMLLMDHGHLLVEPGASERELLIAQSVAVGDQCLTNNSTYFEITAGNTTLVKQAPPRWEVRHRGARQTCSPPEHQRAIQHIAVAGQEMAKTHETVGMLVNLSSEDILLVQYQLQRERMYLGLYLYARNLSASTAHREEMELYAKRLGLDEEKIVYAPWKKELCRVKEMEEGTSPCMEPTAEVTASPPAGTHQPGSASDIQ